MDAQVTIHTGRILLAAPFENQYVVSTDQGTMLATALETGSGRRSGHIGGGGYVPGASVLVAEIVRTEETSTRISFPNLILGAFNAFPTYNGTEFLPTEIVPDTDADALRNEAYRRILESQETVPLLNENRGANRPIDILPGDWFKSTVLGGCVLLSEFMTRISSTPDCGITFHGLDKMAELVSHNFSADHGSIFRELIHRGLTPIDVSRFAHRLSEAMGGSPSFEPSGNGDRPDDVQVRDADQTGFFRRELFQGGVEGVWDVFRTDDQNRELHVFGDQLYPGVASKMERMDGIMRIRAAKEIRFEKTYGIVTPWMKRELRGAVPEPEPEPDDRVDIEFKRDELGLQSDDEVSALRPLLNEYFATAEEEKLFFQGLKRDQGVWHFPTKEDVKKQVFDDQDPDLRTLGEQEQEYSLADVVSRDVEVYPGRKIRLFKNSSVFLMAEDGGLILGDGYGAELRMNRGSLTIAAAGDCRVLPGRDLVEQIPGNRISRVGQRVETSSTDGAIVQKAHTNIHLCSGGEEGGALILENRSRPSDLSRIETDALLKGLPFGAGIILKNLYAGTSIHGRYLHAGAYADGSNSTNGMDESGSRCDIMMNAGGGDIGLRGSNAVMSFRNSAALTMMQQATGIYLQQNRIMALAREEVTAVTQGLVVDKAVGKVNRPMLTAAKVDVSRKDSLPASDPVFEVNGAIQAKGAIATKGSVVAEDAVTSNQGANFEPITDPSRRVRVKLNTEDATRQDRYRDIAVAAAQISKTLLERMVAKGINTEYGQKVTELAFPDSNTAAYRARDYSMVAPRWQQMLPDNSSTWIEREVAHAILGHTYPYPGRTVYENGKPVIVNQGKDIVRKPLNQYKINI